MDQPHRRRKQHDHTRRSWCAINYTDEKATVNNLDRITFDAQVMGGKPCIRGLRVTVGMVVGLVAAGHTNADILRAYPYLEEDDIPQALTYAAWRAEEIELPLNA